MCGVKSNAEPMSEPGRTLKGATPGSEAAWSTTATHGTSDLEGDEHPRPDSSAPDTNDRSYSINRWLEQTLSEDAIGVHMLRLKIMQTSGSGTLVDM
jgi:hypothetical protein